MSLSSEALLPLRNEICNKHLPQTCPDLVVFFWDLGFGQNFGWDLNYFDEASYNQDRTSLPKIMMEAKTIKMVENILHTVAKKKDIKNYEIKSDLDLDVGDGFNSVLIKGVILNTDTGKSLNILIKKAPNREHQYDQFYLNEILFYSNTLPALQAIQKQGNASQPFDNTAVFLGSGIEPKNEFIVMENLSSQGYVLVDKKKPFDRDHLEFVFRTYGKFHALSFVLRKKNPELYQSAQKGYVKVYQQLIKNSSNFMENAVSAAIDSLDPQSTVYKEVKDLRKNASNTLLNAFNYSGKYRCITHGDCWSNNMLFKYSESGKIEDMKLIDFQLPRDTTPIHDLSYFFYSGASKADFDILEDYLKVYHKSLSDVIMSLDEDPDELFSFEALLKEWKENALLGVISGIHIWQLKLISKEHYADKLKEKNKSHENTDAETYISFANLMVNITMGETFREKARDILTHAFDYGILRKEKFILDTIS